SHRIAESLADLAETFGPAREAAIARELTKRYESVRRAGLGALAAHFAASEEERRGEFVVLVQGAEAPDAGAGADAGAERVLRLLLAELPLGRAVALAAKITGARRNVLYARALELSGDGASGA
ncbi:MAG TPA: rRNA (cytidine-2'-O-)-methyltransferase, partial [Plasticicumulans sp.]|nr:rRNA (cytidine-2'-O-)-methyltransferase [Plasticicumulans sp.]